MKFLYLCRMWHLYSLVVLCVPLLAFGDDFIRLKKDKDKILGLEIAVTTYQKGDLTVDLVGVAHFADGYYYYKLNKLLNTYDSLLYELVAPEGTVPSHDASTMQGVISGILDLESQMGSIDYKKKHFVHADLDFKGMIDAASKRGETKLTIALAVFIEILKKASLARLAEMNKEGKITFTAQDVLKGLQNPIPAKRFMAKQMVETDSELMNALLIVDRNKKVMEVLDVEIKKDKKKIGIFYGAKHMEDFDIRLLKLGFQKKSQDWLLAWDLFEDEPDPTFRIMRALNKLNKR